MPHHIQTDDISDTFLAGYLVLSPAWASWLVEFNELLTTVSLLTGIGFALVRLWLSLRRRR
jgi:hypothetical protein